MRYRHLFIVPALFVVGCQGATAPGAGALVVAIHQPPEGVAPMVTVTSDRGFQRMVTASTTLTALPTGTYTIVPSAVTADGVRFAGTPLHQTVEVAHAATATSLEVTYAAVTSRLAVSVAGLPGSVPAAILVRGPGFSRTVTSTTQFDLLEPGSYTMTAADIDVVGTTYRATPATLQVTLFPTITLATAYFTYVRQN